MYLSSLYKYIPFEAPTVGANGEIELKRQKCFENGEIWYPRAGNLNDPYDCYPQFLLPVNEIENIVHSLTEEEFIFIKDKNGVSTKEKLIEILKTPYGSNLSFMTPRSKLPTDFLHRSIFFATISALSSYYISNIGILSLTENPFDLRMWAFYGGNSKGICLEFARNPENDLGSETPQPVTYVTERPQVQFHERHLKKDEIITTKFEAWEYESEWRHWKQEGDKSYPFPGDVKKIIFGLNCHDTTINLVKQIFGKNIEYEEIALNKDYSIRTDCGLKHSISKLDLSQD